MQLMLPFEIATVPKPITYSDSILLVGSCFTEHMANRLEQHKFNICSNPHGILFNPLSVADSVNSYILGKQYQEEDLFYLNELWNSWDHHTRFSGTDKDQTLSAINKSQDAAHQFIKNADWVIITLGSAFQYFLRDSGMPVANNHRAPAQWFEKRMLSIDQITSALSQLVENLVANNPKVNIMFTISPVRHIRDGVIVNIRSLARLIEAVHDICTNYRQAIYFPAYELVIDILRDYRFYDIDFVHPNFLATGIVWEHFVESCIAKGEHLLMKQILEINTARNHRTRFPDTEAHRKFLATYSQKVTALAKQYPDLNFNDEIGYFGGE